MKTRFYFLLSVVMIASLSCSDGLVDTNPNHLVWSYNNAPWKLYTKSCYREKGVEIESYNSFSQMMSGIKDIDSFIELCNYQSESRRGIEYQTYSMVMNEAQYDALCVKHSDTANPPLQSDAFYSFPQYYVHFPFSSTDFIQIEVTSSEGFDEDHPAGSSLLDLLHFATTTPNRVLLNNYQLRLDTDVLLNEKGVQLFNTFKLGTDVRPEDMAIINFIFLSFDKLPEPIGPRNIIVRLIADDGTVLCFDANLTFSEIR